MVAYSDSSLLAFFGFILAGLLVLWFAYKALTTSSRRLRYAVGFALAGAALLLFATVAQTLFTDGYSGRMDIATSFWLQTFMYIIAGPLIIWRFGKFFRLFMAPLFAYGLGFVAAGGILFLASLLVLDHTSSGGRGWGGLIFLFLFFADAALAGIGGLLIVIGLVKWMLRSSASGPVEKTTLDAHNGSDEKREYRWKTEDAANQTYPGAPETQDPPESQNRKGSAAAVAGQKSEEGGV